MDSIVTMQRTHTVTSQGSLGSCLAGGVVADLFSLVGSRLLILAYCTHPSFCTVLLCSVALHVRCMRVASGTLPLVPGCLATCVRSWIH